MRRSFSRSQLHKYVYREPSYSSLTFFMLIGWQSIEALPLKKQQIAWRSESW
jgi:hypothetical protein